MLLKLKAVWPFPSISKRKLYLVTRQESGSLTQDDIALEAQVEVGDVAGRRVAEHVNVRGGHSVDYLCLGDALNLLGPLLVHQTVVERVRAGLP